MMVMTRHFKSVSAIHRKFSIIENYLEELMAREIEILNTRETPTLDKELTKRIIDDLHEKTNILKNLREELGTIRAEVGSRGHGIFKHGNIKNKLDQVITSRMIQDLRTEMKECARALEKADLRGDYGVWSKYLREYNDKHKDLPKPPIW
jgi:hypothetical protein